MSKTRALLIDDEKDFLFVMSQRVKTWGYDVVTTSNGNVGVEMIKENQVDIVVVDYMMPEIDGLATVTKIRQINKSIPVIMFTAYPDQRAIEGSEKLGISAFIPKFSSYSDSQSALKTALGIAEKRLSSDK
tara:strand:+ start:921 stop:1313 length:393 start_codon:yes stop_codon:yes gene_type:complete